MVMGSISAMVVQAQGQKAPIQKVADQIAATAELALGKTARRPLALIRGAHPQVAEDGSARSSLMPPDWDLFR